MTETATSVVNEALWQIGYNDKPVTGVAPTFDESVAGKAAQKLYAPCIQSVMREFAWDFSRSTIALSPTGNVAPWPWQYEYEWPENCIQVWQVFPPAGAGEDQNDPLPINYVIANRLVGLSQERVIQTNLVNALAVFNNYPTPDTWDSLFRQAVVRLLASEFALALAGKPGTSQVLIDSGAAFESLGEQRTD